MSHPITVSVKVLPQGQGLPLPEYKTTGAAAADLAAAVLADQPMTLHPGERAAVPTGLAMAIPQGYELQIRSRSGLSIRNGVVVLNGVGTIDSDYRGEIKVIMVNHGQQPFTVERGMRIAQAAVKPVPVVQFVKVEDLDETERGAGGFGSTGLKAA